MFLYLPATYLPKEERLHNGLTIKIVVTCRKIFVQEGFNIPTARSYTKKNLIIICYTIHLYNVFLINNGFKSNDNVFFSTIFQI